MKLISRIRPRTSSSSSSQRRRFWPFWVGLSLLCVMLTLIAQFQLRSVVPLSISPLQAQGTPTSRDPWLWPFSQQSIWNMPIGNGAIYAPAQLPAVKDFSIDPELLYRIPAGSPLRELYYPGSWTNRCRGFKRSFAQQIPMPDALIVPDAVTATPETYSTPNNDAALLQPDGRTLIQIAPMARCQWDGSVYGFRYEPDVDLYGAGQGGSHFGSGLSAIGGSIRRGELTGPDPIRHVLKVELSEQFTSYDPQDPTPGYRWPADRADNYAANYATNGYRGQVPQLQMGALLAIPPWVTAQQLNLRTPAGYKIFEALQDYGAYHVDSTASNTHAIAAEAGIEEEFQNFYGYRIKGDAGTSPFVDDMMDIFQVLAIVTNNADNNIGGGGDQRRAPLAPEFN